MKNILFLVVLTPVISFAVPAGFGLENGRLSLFCMDHNPNSPYPPPGFNLLQDPQIYPVTTATLRSFGSALWRDDHGNVGPVASLVCGNVAEHLETEGKAICSGLYLNDYSVSDGMQKTYFDTPVIVTLSKKADGSLNVIFKMPMAVGGNEVTIANCERSQ